MAEISDGQLDTVDDLICEIEDELEKNEIDTEEIQSRLDSIRDELGIEDDEGDDDEEET